MSINAGYNAIISRIIGMDDPPAIATPETGAVDLPRYVCQPAGGFQSPAGISTLTDFRPEVLVRVETRSGAPIRFSNALVEALWDLFPPGLVFSGLTIEQRPEIRFPLDDGAVYSVPVYIRGRYRL